MKNTSTKTMMHMTFLMLIIVIMSFTPLGFIHLGLIKATLVHIPVIFGSLMFGWKFGASLGFVFGLMSLINNTLTPNILSFAFSPFIPVIGTTKGSLWALVIAFLPRILVGIIPDLMNRKTKSLSLSVLAGALTNTVLVLGLIGVIFNQAYATANNIAPSGVFKVIMGIVFTNGLAEAVISVLILVPVVSRLNKKP